MSKNRTLLCNDKEIKDLGKYVVSTLTLVEKNFTDVLVNNDFFKTIYFFPTDSVDLLILDPPYNLTKNYNGDTFYKEVSSTYREWFTGILEAILPKLKSTATVYVCSEWRTSMIIGTVLEEFFNVRNRITWEREKGRGAKTNWKNSHEDIWFCTVSNKYTFNVDAVKLKRRVKAPYKDKNGNPKDWQETEDGKFRMTCPSNLMTDITVPFWSMPENTNHPTQKPEKLMAKLILASSNEGDLVFDPFAGSGTTLVTAKKLNRHFAGIEKNREYCCLANKRLELAEKDNRIQGFENGVFLERNS